MSRIWKENADKVPSLKLMGSVSYGVDNPDSDINFSLTLRDLPPEEVYNAVKIIEGNFSSQGN